MSAQQKLVAVAGATGKQGGGVVAALLQLGGCRIRALSRNPSSPASAKLAEQGVEVVKADFEDRASLDAAFKGCDAVFAVTDFWVACQGDAEREKKQGINLVDAAKAAGVSHFVFSSLEDTRPALKATRQPLQGPYITPHFDAKAEIEQYAREQLGDGAVTGLYASIFYENLLPNAHSMEPNKQPDGSYTLFVPSKEKLPWVSTPDVGGVAAAAILAGPAKYGGQNLTATGDHLTMEEMAAAFSKVFGKKVVAITPPADEWSAAVQGFGVPKSVADDLANMFIWYDVVGVCGLRPLEQTRELWPKVQGFEAWLEANKEVYKQLFD